MNLAGLRYAMYFLCSAMPCVSWLWNCDGYRHPCAGAVPNRRKWETETMLSWLVLNDRPCRSREVFRNVSVLIHATGLVPLITSLVLLQFVSLTCEWQCIKMAYPGYQQARQSFRDGVVVLALTSMLMLSGWVEAQTLEYVVSLVSEPGTSSLKVAPSEETGILNVLFTLAPCTAFQAHTHNGSELLQAVAGIYLGSYEPVNLYS